MKHLFLPLFYLLLLQGLIPDLIAQVQPNQPEQDCLGALPICSPYISIPVTYTGVGVDTLEILPDSSCLLGGETNGVWFEFHTLDSGLISFSIIPIIITNDYDWAVYNLTNVSCTDIYTDYSLEVSCNFSGISGITGANGLGGNPNNPPIPVIPGETYALYVSNWSGSANGFTLDFTATDLGILDSAMFNGDTVQVDTVTNLPGLNGLIVVLNLPILCSQIDSGDFRVFDTNGIPIPIQSAVGLNCNGSYADSIEIILPPTITPAQLMTLSASIYSGSVYLCSIDSINSTPINFNKLSTRILVENANGDNIICQDDSIRLYTPFSGLPDFQNIWMPGNIQASDLWIGASAGMSYEVNTTYLGTGLSGNSQRNLNVGMPPIWQPLPDTISCADSLLISPPDNHAGYLWSTGDTTAQIWVDRGGPDTLSLIVSDEIGCSFQDTFLIEFGSVPEAEISFSIDNDMLTVSLNGNTHHADSVEWDLGDGSTAVGEQISHTYLIPGTYDIILTARGICGEISDTISISILQTGIESSWLEEVQIMLSRNKLIIDIDHLGAPFYELSLWDANGRRIWTDNIFQAGKSSWSIPTLPNGLYLAKLIDPERRTAYMVKLILL